MMRADIRLWAAIAMIVICAFSIAHGSRIVYFSLAMMNIDSAQNRAEISRWFVVPGLASTALQAYLTDDANPSDLKTSDRRRDALSAMLSVKPLSSYAWLSLSAMQLVTDQPMEQVFASLELSAMTGPNEGYVMPERAIFALSLWERLPPDFKSRAAIDLTPMIFPRSPTETAEVGEFQAVLAAKPAWVRNELREALVATGLSTQEIEKRLGF